MGDHPALYERRALAAVIADQDPAQLKGNADRAGRFRGGHYEEGNARWLS